MTGSRKVLAWARSRRHSSKPSMSGRWMSSTTADGRCSAARSASAPVAASSVGKPAALSSRTVV